MEFKIRCPINIAILKYWGKIEPYNNLQMNSSISFTLDMENIFTETKIKFSN